MNLHHSRPLAALFAGASLLLAACGAAAQSRPAPEFPIRSAQEWINSPPITLASLRGQVVLIDFWTFECWNCYRSFPWLNSVEAKFRDQGLKVVGVHTPEFAREKVIAAIREKVREFKITYPVMVDSDHAYWNALDNRYWPAFYLIDRKGQVRALFVGETHAGDPQAKDIEARIAALLTEPSAAP
ncbi:MAG: redoxin domain-containing protein [Stagnimonas sp.]|nr:redoxin domain-containing protein [Stagnimonas sp.]